MRVLLPILSIAAFGACSHNLFSPPARPMALESPATVGKGQTAGRGHASASAELFGPAVFAGTGGLRHGLSDELETNVDVSYAYVDDPDRSMQTTDGTIVMGRVGGKYRPPDFENLALQAGLGGGYAPAAGSFANADVGVVVGYENRYVVPFLSVGGFASVPIEAKQVDVTTLNDDETFVDTPQNTLGLTVGAGIRVPIDRYALLLGITTTQLWDRDSEGGYMGMGGGVETLF